MLAMLRIIIREIIVLALSLAVFPAVAIVLLYYTDSLGAGLSVFSHRLDLGRTGPAGIPMELWIRIVAPYAIVQAVRAYGWARRSETGRKWANLYFAMILALLGARSLSEAWDLFYFMHAMGDMPGELAQFVQLEAVNLVIAVVAFSLGLHCLYVFVTGGKRPRPHAGRVE
ncbi:MAG: hypothetical protein RDU20_04245 [Desulfomonilaceae bacterium]|nr:hypothetical protein [Desulfomonilaceae bacterium]